MRKNIDLSDEAIKVISDECLQLDIVVALSSDRTLRTMYHDKQKFINEQYKPTFMYNIKTFSFEEVGMKLLEKNDFLISLNKAIDQRIEQIKDHYINKPYNLKPYDTRREKRK